MTGRIEGLGFGDIALPYIDIDIAVPQAQSYDGLGLAGVRGRAWAAIPRDAAPQLPPEWRARGEVADSAALPPQILALHPPEAYLLYDLADFFAGNQPE